MARHAQVIDKLWIEDSRDDVGSVSDHTVGVVNDRRPSCREESSHSPIASHLYIDAS
jgi:hypothetical protein